MAKINLTQQIKKFLLLRGYLPKLHCDILIKNIKQDLKELFQRKKPNIYQIAACRELLKELLKQKHKDELEERKEYEKIYKEKIETTIKKAKSGDNKSLFKLIEWDIRWLFEDWVRRKIIIANGIDNRPFIEGICEAIKSRKNKNKTVHQTLYNELRYLKVLGFNFNNPRETNQLREKLLNIYQNAGISESNKIYKLLYDQDYFTKFLIRHKLKNGH